MLELKICWTEEKEISRVAEKVYTVKRFIRRNCIVDLFK